MLSNTKYNAARIPCGKCGGYITQDYGLASMCLARRTRVLNQNGLEYTPENIEGLLFRRHENKKLLRAEKHPKGTPKRTKEQDITYRNALERILQSA